MHWGSETREFDARPQHMFQNTALEPEILLVVVKQPPPPSI